MYTEELFEFATGGALALSGVVEETKGESTIYLQVLLDGLGGKNGLSVGDFLVE